MTSPYSLLAILFFFFFILRENPLHMIDSTGLAYPRARHVTEHLTNLAILIGSRLDS